MWKLNELKEELTKRWNGRYLYNNITEDNYINTRVLVGITCKKHGDFPMTLHDHLQGHGCPYCKNELLKSRPNYKNRELVAGVGVFDVDYPRTLNKDVYKAYTVWEAMIKRCYSETDLSRSPTYRGCTVCDEWKFFSNFKKWFDENYVKGYALDKDIICKGNKCYCPDFCSFIPPRINSMVLNKKSSRGNEVVGVFLVGKKYYAHTMMYGKQKQIGRFDTEIEAFEAYKKTREQYIKDVADDYYRRGLITERVHEALYKWEIEITD